LRLEGGLIYNYQVIYSNRRTLALEITRDLRIVVRAPHYTSEKTIADFVSQREAWINQHYAVQEQRVRTHPEPTADEVNMYIEKARAYIPDRVAYYSAIMGVKPAGIRITGARTRFGSCSGKNKLCFSWRVMQYPVEAVDYVVVHELAHIRFKNHQKEFYDFVAFYMPDYKQRAEMLKK
jgi:predicted metal-dependent hydrolase